MRLKSFFILWALYSNSQTVSIGFRRFCDCGPRYQEFFTPIQLKSEFVDPLAMNIKNIPLALCFFSFIATPLFAEHAGTTVTATEALNSLKEGNVRFVKGKAEHPNADAKTRHELVSGQKPHTIVLSCSDSRVPPELIFDKGLGEVFPIRVAGNVISSQGVASIEYAVAHLGSKVLLVMGHESCGAVKAALDTPVGTTAGSYDLDNLLSAIRPNVDTYRHVASSDKKLRSPVISNVNAVTCGLLRRSKIVRDAVQSGQLKISPSIYSLETGKVDFWEANCPGRK